MNSAKTPVLISVGSERVVFAIPRLLSEGGKRAVMTGNAERLNDAATKLHRILTILADATKEEDVIRITDQLKKNSPALNVIINHGGKTFVNKFLTTQAHSKASAEILTQLFIDGQTFLNTARNC